MSDSDDFAMLSPDHYGELSSEEDEIRCYESMNEEKEVVLDEKLWEALPRELLEKILTSLPPAAHFRFRAVCKRWNSLISCPGWLQQYVQGGSRPSCTVMCVSASRKVLFFCHSELKWFDIPFNPSNHREMNWELVDTDAGILCYQCYLRFDLWLCVCNPLTQSFTILPPIHCYCIEWPPRREVLKLLVNKNTLAFKVVVLVSCYPSITEVYDSTTSSWILHKSFPSQSFRRESNFVWKSNIYWQCFSTSRLLTFDVDSGVWSEVDTQLPGVTLWNKFMVNNNGKILLVRTSSTAVMEPISVWMLLTDNSQSTLNFSRASWVQVSINVPKNLRPFLRDMNRCFSQTNRICFSNCFSDEWVSYSFATNSWHVMPPWGVNPESCYFYECELRLDMDVALVRSSEDGVEPLQASNRCERCTVPSLVVSHSTQ